MNRGNGQRKTQTRMMKQKTQKASNWGGHLFFSFRPPSLLAVAHKQKMPGWRDPAYNSTRKKIRIFARSRFLIGQIERDGRSKKASAGRQTRERKREREKERGTEVGAPEATSPCLCLGSRLHVVRAVCSGACSPPGGRKGREREARENAAQGRGAPAGDPPKMAGKKKRRAFASRPSAICRLHPRAASHEVSVGACVRFIWALVVAVFFALKVLFCCLLVRSAKRRKAGGARIPGRKFTWGRWGQGCVSAWFGFGVDVYSFFCSARVGESL